MLSTQRTARMRYRSLLVVIVPALVFGPRLAMAEKAPAAGAPSAKGVTVSFAAQVRPLLVKYCVDCHGGAKPKGGVDLAAFTDESAAARDQKLWARVGDQVEDGDMPPRGKPRPTPAEVAVLSGWIAGQFAKLDCGKTSDPGRITIRRLNRSEYNNTVRDLVGVDFSPADDFPSDDVGYGFDNIGDVLTMPPILMEKYLAAAEKVAESAIVAGRSAQGPTKTWECEELDDKAGGSPYQGFARMLASAGEITVSYDFPRNATYLLRARAFGEQAGSEPTRLALKIDGKVLKTFDVKAVEKEPAVVEFKAKLRGGPRKFSVAFLNDFYDEKRPEGQRDRNLAVDYLEVQGPLPAEGDPLPETHRRILFKKPTKATRDEVARAIVERFASRAYRHPVGAGEVARLLKFVDMAEQNGDGFERGIQLVVEAVLVAPQFLFRVELDNRRKTGVPPGPQFLTDFELASRLSYFLWSSMPDEELTQLALTGKLRAEDNLEKQVRRMLKDKKAKALVENFGGQWLQIRNLKNVNPDKARFPAFDDALRTAMQHETELFLESIIREDRSVLDLIDANYSFLNERLARHYGVAGVKGDQFRRVFFQNDQRGGLLTQASILTITSNPTRTSPVKRGKYILDQVLGTPPPPPPPEVPDLKDDQANALSGTLRQRMEQHRANPACASCHARMDPLGFGFENYDAIGAWRDKEGDHPIDTSGTLPNGQTFQGAKALKTLLKAKDKEIARCLTEKMLTYALGRGLEYYDRCAVDRIVESLAQNQYKSSRLILGIVQSDPFLKRKGKGD